SGAASPTCGGETGDHQFSLPGRPNCERFVARWRSRGPVSVADEKASDRGSGRSGRKSTLAQREVASGRAVVTRQTHSCGKAVKIVDNFWGTARYPGLCDLTMWYSMLGKD